jgi:hypothetical protein
MLLESGISKPIELYFNDDTHTYTDSLGNPYVSVTTYLNNYFVKFDTKAVAKRCARAGLNGNPKYAGKSAKDLEREWEKKRIESSNKGKKEHSLFEDNVNSSNGYNETFGEKKQQGKVRLYTIDDIIENENIGLIDLSNSRFDIINQKYPKSFKILEYFVSQGFKIYSELGLFSFKFLISGTSDIVLIKDNTYFVIIDWKTNAAPIMFRSGHFEKDVNGGLTKNFIYEEKFCKYPLNKFESSIGNKMKFQLGSYAQLLELKGLSCQGLFISHLQEGGDELIPLTYDSNLIFKLFNFHYNTRIANKEIIRII